MGQDENGNKYWQSWDAQRAGGGAERRALEDRVYALEDDLDALSLPTGAKLAYDIGKNPVVLFSNEWSANYFTETNKNCPLSALPVQTARD